MACFPEVLPFSQKAGCVPGAAAGGSLVIIDVDRRMTFAYVMNKMAPGVSGPSQRRWSSGCTTS